VIQQIVTEVMKHNRDAVPTVRTLVTHTNKVY